MTRRFPLLVVATLAILVLLGGVRSGFSDRVPSAWGLPAQTAVGHDGHMASGAQWSALAGPASRAAARVRSSALSTDVPSDSALDELAVGRFWHASMMLRAEGLADSDPEHVLLLASAEAGWNNWAAVRLLLGDAEWLADIGDADGLFLLARAMEQGERWEDATHLYARYAEATGAAGAERLAAEVRRVRSLWRAGRGSAAQDGLDALAPIPVVRSWLAADLARDAAQEGDTASTRLLLAQVTDAGAAAEVWRADADALLAAGDPMRALAAYEALASPGTAPSVSGSRAVEAGVEAGRLYLSEGDTAAARPYLERGAEAASGSARARAAAALVDLGGLDAADNARLASILDRAGDGRRALRAYDRAFRLFQDAGGSLGDVGRIARARLLGTVRDRQDEALGEFRELRETLTDRRLGARNLQVWAQMRRRQGRSAAEATIRRWLVEDYPESAQAAELVFMRGYDAEQAGRTSEALRHYADVTENAPTHNRAGQARMRAGQIYLSQAALEDAALTFEAYLEDFPEGRRWEEASYWAGRTRLELGDVDAGIEHLRRVMAQPISYYAVMAAELADEPYTLQLSPGVVPREPDWLTEGLERLDLLAEAELQRGAEAEVARLRGRAQGDRAVTARLAEALIERGRTIDGINLGWAMVEEGGWDATALRIAFPFPYQELVRREADEWGVDPIMLAALIRQESAFKADIVSHAGAIGLMQVMPPTGAQLARVHGPDGFSADALANPEVNLHLGSAFLVDMTRRFDGTLPLVLSAYNAGPSRAVRWRTFPEVVDELRFTERIPFVETRGYVKNVRRNLGLYRALSGEQDD
jgi:soluble lytic murein transglycosylase